MVGLSTEIWQFSKKLTGVQRMLLLIVGSTIANDIVLHTNILERKRKICSDPILYSNDSWW